MNLPESLASAARSHMTEKYWPRLAIAAAFVVAAGVLSTIIPPFYALQWSSWIIYGILGLSLVWTWGKGGIFSFGQGAFFGIGAYAYGIAAINLLPLTGETFSAIIIAVLIAAMAAALLGYFMFYGRIGDVYVAIVTLATSLVLLTFMTSTADRSYRIGSAYLGGYNGMVGIPPLTFGFPGHSAVLSFSAVFVLIAALAAALVVALSLLLQTPLGRVIAAVRESELRSQLLGYDVRRSKLVTLAIGGAIAGLAGALFASWAMFINPQVFGLQQAALIVIWALVGGRTSLTGAFVGAVLVQGLTVALGGVGGGITPMVLGVVLILVVLLLPLGLVPTMARWLRAALPVRHRPAKVPATRDDILEILSQDARQATLATEHLSKNFDRVEAVSDLSIEFGGRGVHCLLGPNGAGKSSFFNLLVGRFSPSGGRILLGGSDITSMQSHLRVRKGLGIKLQVPCLFMGLTVFENLWLAAYPATRDAAGATQRAFDLAAWLGLAERLGDLAGVLAHGQQQWLEIGMVLLGQPDVILLDEPTAGMTGEETLRTAELITQLGRNASVIVVEHDMEFVRRLNVPSVVFHQGRIFARGSLEELQQNEAVLDIYLGRGRPHAQA